MMELSLLLSIVSIVFSFFSVLFLFMKFGINITQEFCERSDVIERKEKLESVYREKLNEEWRELIEIYPEKSKLGEEAVYDLFILGRYALLSTLPSTIIARISSFTEQMISSFICVILSIVGVAVTYLLQIYFPYIYTYPTNGVAALIFFASIILAYQNGKEMKGMIPKIIKLRRQFFSLSESDDLDELQDLNDELREGGIL